MTRENYDPASADQQATQPDAIEDLSSESITAKDAEQVKGGFNPQPDPPKVQQVDVSQVAARAVKL
jgi:hypothetical protein